MSLPAGPLLPIRSDHSPASEGVTSLLFFIILPPMNRPQNNRVSFYSFLNFLQAEAYTLFFMLWGLVAVVQHLYE